jgi:hypothetical protein
MFLHNHYRCGAYAQPGVGHCLRAVAGEATALYAKVRSSHVARATYNRNR